jgi:hypothetical protein
MHESGTVRADEHVCLLHGRHVGSKSELAKDA